ncbi:hypothetical protein C8Q74DRAFT_1401783 [Fomes fomentarius]|nr:hypothetical protein C8Q74DRAFT_1401783 [Fomes fomentarius]
MVEFNSQGRQLVKAFNNHLANVSDKDRFKVLSSVWQTLARFSDFSREGSLFWTTRCIPSPGECFSVSRQDVLDGLEYEDLVYSSTLTPEYKEPKLLLDPVKARSWFESEKGAFPSRRTRATKGVTAGRKRKSDHPWRRYAVSNMDYGWTLHTVTAVRENKDCRGWFMNSAVDFCHLPEEPDDLGIAYALKFHTWTTLAKVSEKAPERKPPPALYFYERVHRNAHISLDPTVEWPWGFWSTIPNDACGRRELDPDQTHRPHASRHSITYMGCSADGKHTWVQLLGDWMFYIETQVEVQYYKLTPDECLVLREMRRCASDEDRADGNFELEEVEPPTHTTAASSSAALFWTTPLFAPNRGQRVQKCRFHTRSEATCLLVGERGYSRRRRGFRMLAGLLPSSRYRDFWLNLMSEILALQSRDAHRMCTC